MFCFNANLNWCKFHFGNKELNWIVIYTMHWDYRLLYTVADAISQFQKAVSGQDKNGDKIKILQTNSKVNTCSNWKSGNLLAKLFLTKLLLWPVSFFYEILDLPLLLLLRKNTIIQSVQYSRIYWLTKKVFLKYIFY